jgi:hypothetical protein
LVGGEQRGVVAAGAVGNAFISAPKPRLGDRTGDAPSAH